MAGTTKKAWKRINPDCNGNTDKFECSACKNVVEFDYKEKKCLYKHCPWCGEKKEKTIDRPRFECELGNWGWQYAKK